MYKKKHALWIGCILLLTACGKEKIPEVSYVDVAPKESEPLVLIPEGYTEEEVEVQEDETSTTPEEKIFFVDQKQVAYSVVEGQYHDGDINVIYPTFTQMENAAVQDQINQTLQKEILGQLQSEDLISCDIRYEVASAGSGIFSCVLRGTAKYQEKAFEEKIAISCNVDLTTGASLRLKDYADIEQIVSCLEQNYGYEILNETDRSQFQAFLNNGYVLDYAIMLLDYDLDFKNENFVPLGYSYIKDNRLALLVPTEHSLGDYTEILFEHELN